jgi:hypothetical protein
LVTLDLLLGGFLSSFYFILFFFVSTPGCLGNWLGLVGICILNLFSAAGVLDFAFLRGVDLV